MYYARKRLKINGEYREIGEAVPEAFGWLTVEAYIRAGQIDWVEPEVKPEPKKKVKAEKPAPVVEEEEEVEPSQKLIEAIERLEGLRKEKPSEEKTAK